MSALGTPCVVPNKLQPHGGDFIVADHSNALKYIWRRNCQADVGLVKYPWVGQSQQELLTQPYPSDSHSRGTNRLLQACSLDQVALSNFPESVLEVGDTAGSV